MPRICSCANFTYVKLCTTIDVIGKSLIFPITEQRNDIYEAKTISRYFPRGGEYKKAKEVIAIYILNYNLFGFDDYILDTVKVLNKHRDYQVDSISKEYYIQLPKFRESNPDMNDKLNQWLAVIDDEDRGRIEMAKAKNKIIEEAEVEIKYFTADEEARYLVDLRDMWESDRNSEIGDAEERGREKRNKRKSTRNSQKTFKYRNGG